MNKLTKIALGVVGLLVVVIILAMMILPLVINPNDYKSTIEQQVQSQTGRKLTISGDIDLSLSLPLSVAFELGKTELGNSAEFIKMSDKPFASINHVAVMAAIFPLLTDNKLEVGEIILDGVNINLLKNKQGSSNWDSFAKNEEANASDKTDKKSTDEKQSDAGDTKAQSLPEVHIGGLKLINTNVVYSDAQSNQHFNLKDFSITISEVAENKPVQLEILGDFSSENPKLQTKIEVKTTAKLMMKQSQFELQNTSLSLNSKGDIIPGGENTTKLSADISLDLLQQTLAIEKLTLSSYDVTISGHTKVSSLLSDADFSGQVDIEQFSPKELSKRMAIQLPEMKNSKVLEKFKVSMQFAGNKKSVSMTSLKAVIDEIVLSGKATINNLVNPAYDVKLDINQLHLDDYALKDTTVSSNKKVVADKTEAETETAQADANAPLIPVKLLRSLNVNGQLTIGEIIAAGAKMENVLLTLKAKGGRVELNPVQSDFYQGKLNLSTLVDVTRATPKINFQQNFEKIDLGKLLLDTTGTQEFTGNATINSTFNTAGNDKNSLIKNSNGKGKFVISNGYIKKLDILNTIRTAQLLLKGQPAATKQQEKNTAFTELKGSFVVKNGVAKNNDLYAKTPLMEVTGKGYADLPKEYLDYTLQVKVLNSLRIEKKSGGADFRGKVIPYTIKGKFNELNQKADLQQMIKQQLESGIKKKVNEKVNNLFKGFF